MCAESVLRGSDIFVKGVRSIDRRAMKDQRVCLAVDLENCDLPRGSDCSLFTGKNVYFLVSCFLLFIFVGLLARECFVYLAVMCFLLIQAFVLILSIEFPVRV